MKTIATVGGLGRSPIGAGTLGSLVGLGVSLILSGNPTHQWVGCLVATGLGFWSAGPTARAMGKNDPGSIIIDEVAGMMISLVALPVTWPVYLAGFLLFRFLDIFKPFPLKRVERLPGSWGIMLDDLLAGLITNLIVRVVLPAFA